MKKLAVLLSMVGLLAVSASAFGSQRSRIHGKVTDQDGNPVVGASITAENPNSIPSTRTKTTDKKGKYAFNSAHVGNWTLFIEADGYIPHQATIRVGVGKNVKFDIVLERAEGADLLAVSSKAQREIDEARRRFEAGDYEGAIQLYQELLETAPDVHQIHFNLGLAYERAQNDAKAAEHYALFVEKEPENFDATLFLANALSRTDKQAEALPYYQKCTELQPENAVAFFNLGLAFFESEQLPESAAAFERCLKIDPNLADAHYMLGGVHLRQQDPDAARQSYEKFLELAPDSPNAGAARDAIERLSES
jgi:tetratricopeptide (TPR) repeat protein